MLFNFSKLYDFEDITCDVTWCEHMMRKSTL